MHVLSVLKTWLPAVTAMSLALVAVPFAAASTASRSWTPAPLVAFVLSMVATVVGVILLTATAHLTQPPAIGAQPERRMRRWLLSAPGTAVGLGAFVAFMVVATLCVRSNALATSLAALTAIVVLLWTASALWAVVGSQTQVSGARHEVRLALAQRAPDALLYLGRPDGGRYQAEKWIEVLKRTHSHVLLVVRQPVARRAMRGLESDRVTVVLLPRQADLDLIPASVKVAYYAGSSALNVNMVSYRSMAHVYLGHGDSDKEISVHPSHRMYDRVFLAGEAARERYVDAGVRMDPESLRVVGRPLDVSPVEDPGSAPRSVLYAPTWGGYNRASTLSTLPQSEWIVRGLLATGVTVLFRPHPLSLTSRIDAAHVAAVDRILAEAGPQHQTSARTAGPDVTRILGQADAMVTDVSSMLIEFLPRGGRIAIAAPPSLDLSKYPSAAVASRVADAAAIAEWVEGDDVLASQREQLSRWYVETTDYEVFADAVRELLAR